MIRVRFCRSVAFVACLLLLGGLVVPGISEAKSAAQIDKDVTAALARFDQQVKGGAKFIAASHGVVVFPEVVKAAFLYGVQYGEGALRVGGRDTAYYSFKGGSSMGILSKDIILVFRDAASLKHFESSSAWQVGVDGSVVLAKVGAGTDLSTMQMNEPIAGFVMGSKGLMFDVSLTGSKITPLHK